MADDGVKLSTKEEKTFAELKALGGVKIPVLKKDVNLYQMPIEEISPVIFDSVCETQIELLASIMSDTIHTILWNGNTTLIDLVATAGTFKLIYCPHYSLRGKNCTLVAPAGKNIVIYGDLNCAAPDSSGYSWTLNSTSTSYIKCKWIRNSGSTGKIICDVGTVLYERLESGLTLQTNESVGSESYIKQEFWDNTNNTTEGILYETFTAPTASKYSQKISARKFSIINDISNTVTTLIIVCDTPPDLLTAYIYGCQFATPSTLGITTFKVVGPGNETVAVGNTLTSRVIKFSAAQLNHIYATLADQTIVTATESISYAVSTSTLSVGSETLVLDGAATEDVYFVCSGAFGVVTAVGTEFDIPKLYQDVKWIGTEPSLEASKTYELSVLNGLAVIGVSV